MSAHHRPRQGLTAGLRRFPGLTSRTWTARRRLALAGVPRADDRDELAG